MSRRSDSGDQGHEASDISVVVDGHRAVTAARDGEGNLKLTAWRVSQTEPIEKLGDSGDQAKEASLISVVALGDDHFLTASRTAAGNLRLIRWRLNRDGSFDRLDSSRDEDGEPDVGEIAVANVSMLVVTAVRAANGNLKVILWQVQTGAIVRRSNTGQQAGEASLIRLVVYSQSRIYTSCRTREGRLIVIAWSFFSEPLRIGDSGEIPGEITENSLTRLDDDTLVSAIGTVEGPPLAHTRRLRLIHWKVRDGAVAWDGDSANQAGEVRGVSVVPSPIFTGLPGLEVSACVSAVLTKEECLRLIAWDIYLRRRLPGCRT